jgi:hypothetical protein
MLTIHDKCNFLWLEYFQISLSKMMLSTLISAIIFYFSVDFSKQTELFILNRTVTPIALGFSLIIWTNSSPAIIPPARARWLFEANGRRTAYDLSPIVISFALLSHIYFEHNLSTLLFSFSFEWYDSEGYWTNAKGDLTKDGNMLTKNRWAKRSSS